VRPAKRNHALEETSNFADKTIGSRRTMNATTWTITEAKANFKEVIDRAISVGPQTITRRGRASAVVVAAQEWQRRTERIGTLADFFANSPLRESGLKLPRRTRPRKVRLI
jgi:prevent-host-death family protein